MIPSVSTHKPLARLATALIFLYASSLPGLATAVTFGEDELSPELAPSVAKACGGGAVGNRMLLGDVHAENCDLVATWDHYECWGTGGAYRYSSFTRITTADCNPDPSLFGF